MLTIMLKNIFTLSDLVNRVRYIYVCIILNNDSISNL